MVADEETYNVFLAAMIILDEMRVSTWVDQFISSMTGRKNPMKTGIKHTKKAKAFLKLVNWIGWNELFFDSELENWILFRLLLSNDKKMNIINKRIEDNCNAVVKSYRPVQVLKIPVVNVGIAKCCTAPKSAKVSIATKVTPAMIAGLIKGIDKLNKVEIEFLPKRNEASIIEKGIFIKATLETIYT